MMGKVSVRTETGALSGRAVSTNTALWVSYVEPHMGGITFFGTRALEAVTEFYVDRLGAEVWLEQPDCTIFQYDNLLFGFCDRAEAETEVTMTFVVPDRAAVDAVHEELAEVAREPPRENERYEIYQFFANDPEGRTVEVQTFLHPTPPI